MAVEPKEIVNLPAVELVVSIPTTKVAKGNPVDPTETLFVNWDDPVHPVVVAIPTALVVEKFQPVPEVSTTSKVPVKSEPPLRTKLAAYATPDSDRM